MGEFFCLPQTPCLPLLTNKTAVVITASGAPVTHVAVYEKMGLNLTFF